MLSIILFSMVLSSMTTIIIQRKHLLMTLLSFEAMVLTLSLLMVFSLGQMPFNSPYVMIILLTFGACEASLGLSLMVSMTRNFGSDNVNLLTMNKC
uniref:NADH dehydrogenase subunit 4L n=1 Tax=Loimia medusa TaxID=167822 RepID=UPI0031F3EAD2